MREFGVGRPAVREALFHLQRMGLVELRSGGRARAIRPTPKIVVESLAGSARYMLRRAGRRAAFPGGALVLRDGPGALRGRSTRPTRICATCTMPSKPTASRSATSSSSRRPTSVPPHPRRHSAQPDLSKRFHAAISEWLVEQRHVTLTYPAPTRLAYNFHAQILRSDRRARSRPGRGRDPGASGSGRRALLAREGSRRMNDFVIVVDSHLKPGAKAGFRRLIDENARTSCREEPGCRPLSTCWSRRAKGTASCSMRSTTIARRSMRTSRPAILRASTKRVRRWWRPRQ